MRPPVSLRRNELEGERADMVVTGKGEGDKRSVKSFKVEVPNIDHFPNMGHP